MNNELTIFGTELRPESVLEAVTSFELSGIQFHLLGSFLPNSAFEEICLLLIKDGCENYRAGILSKDGTSFVGAFFLEKYFLIHASAYRQGKSTFCCRNSASNPHIIELAEYEIELKFSGIVPYLETSSHLSGSFTKGFYYKNSHPALIIFGVLSSLRETYGFVEEIFWPPGIGGRVWSCKARSEDVGIRVSILENTDGGRLDLSLYPLQNSPT